MKQKLFALTVLKFAVPMLLFGSTASAATTQGAVANTMTMPPYSYNQCMSFSYNLSRGMADRSTNYEVTKLQKFLKTKDNMYPEGWVTGYFGPATERAVKRLQLKLGVSATGRLDESSRAILKSNTCNENSDFSADLRVIVRNPYIACITTPCPDSSSGVKVSLRGDGFSTSAITDINGNADFGELEPGTYKATAALGDMTASGLVTVTGVPGQTLVLTLGRNINDQGGVPIIDGVKGPTMLKPNETGTWSVSARHPQNGTLSYSVNWGDEYSYAMGATNRMINDTEVRQTSTFTHAYQYPGNYTIIFYVKNEAGEYAKSTMTVTVGATTSSDLRVISPNGGEYWNRGYNQTISWAGPTQPPCPAGVYCTPMMPRYYNITLEPHYPPCLPYSPCPMYAYVMPYKIAENVYGTQYSWNVGQNLDASRYVPEGQYKIKVCDTVSGVCDSSDSPFILSTVMSAY